MAVFKKDRLKKLFRLLVKEKVVDPYGPGVLPKDVEEKAKGKKDG